jgi:hypothetical protein
MTIRYVYHASAQDDSDAEWNSSTISYLTYQAALTAWVIGDSIYQAHDHAETSAVTLTLICAAATTDDRVPIHRVNRITGAYDPTTGSDVIAIDVTGVDNDLLTEFPFVWHGCHLRATDRIKHNTVSYKHSLFIDSYIEPGGFWDTAITGICSYVKSKNTTIEFNSIAYWYNDIDMRHEGLAVVGASNSLGLIRPGGTDGPLIGKMLGGNFTGLTSLVEYELIDADRAGLDVIDFDFIACNWRTSQAIVDLAALDSDFQFIRVHNSNDDGSTYIAELYAFRGSVYTDTSVYFIGTGAAQDADGDTPVSREMVPTANCSVHDPMQSIDMIARVDTTGSKTLSVEIAENFTAALTRQECWIEVLSLNGVASTLWSLSYDEREFVEVSYTNLDAGAGLASWEGEPVGSRSEVVQANVTINKAGMFLVRLHLGKYESGKEFFYNPVVTVS